MAAEVKPVSSAPLEAKPQAQAQPLQQAQAQSQPQPVKPKSGTDDLLGLGKFLPFFSLIMLSFNVVCCLLIVKVH